MRTGRPKVALILTDDERRRLDSSAHRSRSAPQVARRARIILACAEGADGKVVARRLHVTPATVCKWRGRFVRQRLDGLYDEPSYLHGHSARSRASSRSLVGIKTINHHAKVVDAGRLDPCHSSGKHRDEQPACAGSCRMLHSPQRSALNELWLRSAASARICWSTRSITSSGVDVPAVMPTVPTAKNHSGRTSDSV